jgi:hydrophobic/amphiphilic exporter-1 (mainly G- bacteria), HAE1 family
MNPSPGIFGTFVRRPVGVAVITLTLALLGILCYFRLPLEMLPGGVQGTNFSVWVSHPGSSPQENAEKVARPIEEQFRTLPDLDQVFSRSSQGSVMLRVRFNSDGDSDLFRAELRDRIERARGELPDTVQDISIWANGDSDLPVMFFAITANKRTQELDQLIEQRVQRRLEAVDGVSRVQVWGLLSDGIYIWLDEEKVTAARMDIGDLIERLSSDNFAKPMGEVTDGNRRFLLRSDMRFGSLEDVERYPVGNGLVLSDIGRVSRAKSVGERLTRINGRLAFWGMVQKESDANVVEVSDRIDAAIAEIRSDPRLIGEVGIEKRFDQAQFIRNSLDQLQSTAMWGGGFAVLVLFMFLRRWRTTLVVALSIPISVLLALVWEYFGGGTFNVMTMTGLTLALGMLVDNSVVVIESIARQRQLGLRGARAAAAGVRDVGLAVFMATLTTVCVIVPMVLMIEQRQLKIFLVTIFRPLSIALISSLLVALVFIPAMASLVAGERPKVISRLGSTWARVEAVPVRGLAWIIGSVRWVFVGSVWLTHRCVRAFVVVLAPVRIVVALAIITLTVWTTSSMATEHSDPFQLGLQSESGTGTLVLAVILGMVAFFGLGRWRNRSRQGPLMPTRIPLEGTSVMGWLGSANNSMVSWALSNRTLGSVVIATVFFLFVPVMGTVEFADISNEDGRSEIEIDVRLESGFTLWETSQEMQRYEKVLDSHKDELGFDSLIVRYGRRGGELGVAWETRMDRVELEKYRRRLREILPIYPGHELRFSRQQELGNADSVSVHFQLRGPDADELAELGELAKLVLKKVPGLTDVRTSLDESPEEVQIAIDREMAFDLGIDSNTAVQNISWALRGVQLPRFQERGREVPFIIEYDKDKVSGLGTVQDLNVWNGESRIALAAITDMTFASAPRSIRRLNGSATFYVQATIDTPSRMAQRSREGYDALESELPLPRGFSFGRDQSRSRENEAQLRQLKAAGGLSIVLVILLMAILFESLVLPLSVLVTIGFALTGAFVALSVTRVQADFVSFFGLLLLVGLVVNNGIVLVDKIHRLRVEDGLDRRTAVIRGAEARVRPILMTALTTIFGLLPMALSQAPGMSIDYQALAVCMIGGLTCSTLFTLWGVPLAYTLFDDLGRHVRWTMHSGTSRKRIQIDPVDPPNRKRQDEDATAPLRPPGS